MNVYIPVADVTLTSGGTYDGQLPVWSTRPLIITCTPDFISSVGYDLHIDVISGGAVVKSISFPYSVSIDVDASFAALLLPRADRNASQYIPECWLRIWSQSVGSYIKIPVFHADLTYWHTLGNQSSLPQPIKPRIPGQTLDIFYPKRTQQQATDAYNVVAEPVTGYPSTVIFPTKYILGKTIDISYIKKLTIKDYPSAGLTYDINYEDRLPSSAVDDASLQCALRARWNMQNGQWFWAAFKDYYWTNKFTTIRGRGGVTDQATVTVNLEYGREWYTVYQQLLTSSNIVFDLMIDGINQYSDKQFRAEVVGDTGARWNNASKLYRQQVQFRTTELQDNYLFPGRPDQPAALTPTFSAQFNPWSSGPAKRLDVWNNITANADWYVDSEPSWYAVANGTELFTPDMFEQGGLDLWAKGKHYSQWKTSNSNQIRLKEPIYTLGEVYSLIGAMDGFLFQVLYVDANGNATDDGGPSYAPINTGRRNLAGDKGGFMLRFIKPGGGPITPNEVSDMQLRYGKRYWIGKAGVQYIFGYMLENTSTSSRNGILSLRSMAGSVSFNLPVIQAGKVSGISTDLSSLTTDDYQKSTPVTVTSANAWSVSDRSSWITPSAYSGSSGATTVNLLISVNATTYRTGYITFRNDVTGELAIVNVSQGGQQDTLQLDRLQRGGLIEHNGPDSVQALLNTSFEVSDITVTVQSGADWVDANVVTMGGNKYLQCEANTVNDDPEPRAALVWLTAGLKKECYTIAQLGTDSEYIILTPAYTLDGKFDVVTSNVVPTSTNAFRRFVICDDVFVVNKFGGSFLNIDISGTGQSSTPTMNEMNVQVRANTTASSRTATVEVDREISAQFVVTQAALGTGKYLDTETNVVFTVPKTTYYFDTEILGNLTGEQYDNINFKVRPAVSWINGDGVTTNHPISVIYSWEVQANNTGKPRTGFFYYEYEGLPTIVIQVNQLA